MLKVKWKLSIFTFAIFFCIAALVGGVCLAFVKSAGKDDGLSHAANHPLQPEDNQAWTEEHNTIPIYPGENIHSPEQLAYIAAKVNILQDRDYQQGTFYLETTIDLSAHAWQPIGTEEFPFMGQLINTNGQGIITSMFVERSATSDVPENAGLFGVLAGNAVVDGLKIEYSLINYLSRSANCLSAGAIAGKMLEGSMVLGCTTEGVSIWAKTNAGGIVGEYSSARDIEYCNTLCELANSVCENAGGIVGLISAGYSGSINQCISDSTINGRIVGGIVGRDVSTQGGSIGNCTNKGIVSATGSGADAGGIIGYTKVKTNLSSNRNYGKVTTSGGNAGGICGSGFANAIVRGNTNSGQVVGLNAGGIIGSAIKATVSNNKNSGIISGTNNIGGIVGLADNSTITKCECSAGINNTNTAKSGSAGGIAGYAKNNTLIDECKLIQAEVVCKKNGGGMAGITESNSRILNGQVENSIIEVSNNNAGGISGSVTQSNCRIENCKFINSAINKSETWNSGSIVGWVGGTGLVITNCSNDNLSEVFGQYAGGIVGGADTTGIINITYCTNNAAVTGCRVGGIAGSMKSVTIIKNCINNAAVTANKGNSVPMAGGIVADCGWQGDVSEITIENCTNTGIISNTGGQYVGGIISYVGSYGQKGESTSDSSLICCKRAQIRYCINKGAVSSPYQDSKVGGIVGLLIRSQQAVIETCTNYANVSSTAASSSVSSVGGIIGWLERTACNIISCINIGAIKGGYDAGGIVGRSACGTISSSHNYGNVTSFNNDGASAGGVVGKVCGWTSNVSNSSNCGQVSGVAAGGVVGSSERTETILNMSGCYNSGDIDTVRTSADLDANKYFTLGGLLGRTAESSKSNITNCFAKCALKAETTYLPNGYVGAMIGGTWSGNVVITGSGSDATPGHYWMNGSTSFFENKGNSKQITIEASYAVVRNMINKNGATRFIFISGEGNVPPYNDYFVYNSYLGLVPKGVFWVEGENIDSWQSHLTDLFKKCFPGVKIVGYESVSSVA